jgi:2,3-bisphosphoglycerate-dependent phosphoglycerate mutase
VQTRFLLLRHAETTHSHVFNGFESDVGLSPRGLRQAAAMAPLLVPFHPAGVISSGMRRALETARPIAEAAGLPVRIEPDLHERKVGILCGKSDAETGGMWSETVRRWQNGDPDYTTEGAESFTDMQRRLLPVWHRLAGEYAGQTVVVVAHGMVKRVLLLSLLGWDMKEWQRVGTTYNVGVCELIGSGGSWQAVRINDLHDSIRLLNEEPHA